MSKFEIQDLKVGGNFISLRVTDNDCHEAEFYFYQLPIDIINKTLNIYGVSLNEKEVEEEYEF